MINIIVDFYIEHPQYVNMWNNSKPLGPLTFKFYQTVVGQWFGFIFISNIYGTHINVPLTKALIAIETWI